MFARIYPLLRLPRRFGVFDYQIPEGMHVDIGDMVRIPFHGRTAYGIVAKLSETTDVLRNISDVSEVTWKCALSTGDVTRIEALAASIVQNPSTLLFHTFGLFGNDTTSPTLVTPPTAPLALSRAIAATLGDVLALVKPCANISVATSQEGGLALAQLLRKKLDGQLLVLVPRERDADIAARLVALGPRTAVLHGTTKPRQRERIIRAWRCGEIDTLIGTRQAALLPARDISAVLVLTNGTDDHFNARRNPRLDTRNAAYAQAAQHGAALVTVDVLPRPEDVATCESHVWSPFAEPVDMVDLRNRETSTDHAMLTIPLLDAMKTALQHGKKVLLSYNRKGIAKRAQCRNCSTIMLCTCGLPYGVDDTGLYCTRCDRKTPVPDACPYCKDGIVGLRGIGNVHIEKSLAELFPNATVGRVEKGHVDSADILLVTEYFFSSVTVPFAKKEFGVVADLAADIGMHPDNFRSGEDTARKLQRLRWFAHQQGARCIVQSWLPEQMCTMVDAEMFITAETAIRERYGLPPKRAVVTVRHADAAALTQLTGEFFATQGDVAVARVLLEKLFTFHFSLFTLPDTAVITIDATYDPSRSTPRTE